VSDIFEEVEERLREDKLQTFLRRYGGVLIGLAIGLVVAVALYSAWDAWSNSNDKALGERFIGLQKEVRTDPAGAEKKLQDFIKSAHGGYKALAEMERAGALEAQGDLPGALAALDNAARHAREPVVKQSAQMRAAYIAAESENFAALEARLKPLIDDRGAFSYQARELLGVEAWEAGQMARARQEFTYLEAAFGAPPGVRQRATSFLQLLGPVDPVAAPAAAPAPAPAPPSATGEKK
jgi:hypothetical protein